MNYYNPFLHIHFYVIAINRGGESKSHSLRGEGENMPVNNGGNNI